MIGFAKTINRGFSLQLLCNDIQSHNWAMTTFSDVFFKEQVIDTLTSFDSAVLIHRVFSSVPSKLLYLSCLAAAPFKAHGSQCDL